MSEILIEADLKRARDTEMQPLQSADSPNEKGNITANGTEPADFTLRSLKSRVEIQAIREVLGQTGWNRKQAARLLKISYRGLLYKIRQHNITR